jgi:hypothetical protein
MAKEIPRASQKRLLRLISARADIQYSQAAYHAFRSTAEPSLRYSTFLAMVISYMRPFTENCGLGRLQCEFPDYPDFDLPEAAITNSGIAADFLSTGTISAGTPETPGGREF